MDSITRDVAVFAILELLSSRVHRQESGVSTGAVQRHPPRPRYNRLKYGKTHLYKPIGVTSGYGSLHISGETFNAMLQLAVEKECSTSNRFGDGPNWRMRVIRAACNVLGLDSDIILKHSFQRGLFAICLARNWRAFLKGDSQAPIYRKMPLNKLVNHWRDRWFDMRKKNDIILEKVKSFNPEQFSIEPVVDANKSDTN